jgi:phosphoesterase RecJ-like protein
MPSSTPDALRSPSPIDWAGFAQRVRSHQRFLLTSHIRPDCDALGSELGMAGVLEALGKDVQIVNGQATPPNLAFIDPDRRLKTIGVDVQPDALGDRQVLMILDTSAWAQLGPMADVVRASRARKILMDHHVGQDELGAELFKNTSAEATGRLVLEAADALDVKLTPAIARPLFAAIATDTGWFRFGSTTSDTMRCAARLVDAGAEPDKIFAELYERDTLARVQLRGRILARATSELDGRLVHTAVLKEDFEATGALASDTEDAINLTLAIAGTEVAVILVEQANGSFKLSFRSRTPRVDCNALAKTLGGGGHKAAAGASIAGPFEKARAAVLDLVRAAMR